MITAIVLGSAASLLGGVLLLAAKTKRARAVHLALPFGAGALLAAAFMDLLPEAFELGDSRNLLLWALGGFTAFFVLERLATWFHHHHSHELDNHHARKHQGNMMMVGDLLHNMIDGVAIGAAFVAGPVTGLITTLAVSAHEIPKELGTFGMLLSRGWRDKKVLLANVLTAFGTLVAAIITYSLSDIINIPLAELLAVTSGIFIYIAASDIIPDIHEQPRRLGTVQAGVLVAGIVVVGLVIRLLGV